MEINGHIGSYSANLIYKVLETDEPHIEIVSHMHARQFFHFGNCGINTSLTINLVDLHYRAIQSRFCVASNADEGYSIRLGINASQHHGIRAPCTISIVGVFDLSRSLAGVITNDEYIKGIFRTLSGLLHKLYVCRCLRRSSLLLTTR